MFTFQVKSEVVKALCNTRQVTGREDHNMSLCGMMARKRGGVVTLCTTDRYVISRYDIPCTWTSTGDDGLGFVPQDLVDIMSRGKRGLFYEIKMDIGCDVSHVTITEKPTFVSSNPAHSYESTYTGYHTDLTRVMNQGKRLDEDACIITSNLMKVLKVGKELFGPDTWCEIAQHEDGVYVVAHNPKNRADFVTHKLSLVLDSVRR